MSLRLFFSVRLLVFAGLFAGVGDLWSADYFVLPKGAGTSDGSSWANAMPQQELQTLLDTRLQAGDHVAIGSGEYTSLRKGSNTVLTIARGGTPEKPTVIEGVDTGTGLPNFYGKWLESNVKYHAHSAVAVALAPGVSDLKLQHLRFEGYMTVISTSANHRNLTLADIRIRRCRQAIELNGVSASSVEDCEVVQYTKRAVSFEAACSHIRLVNVRVDATGGNAAWPTEAFPFGFDIADSADNHHIDYVGCEARNNIFPDDPKKYWNGDGFLAEGKVSNITYTDCLSINNGDGGWDDKSKAPTFIRCSAARNKRGFRIWNSEGDAAHPAILKNCLAVYNRAHGGSGASAGLWTCGAVTAENCTFHNNTFAAVTAENNHGGGAVTLKACILSSDRSVPVEALVHLEKDTTYAPANVVEWIESRAGEDPKYEAPSIDWNGTPATAFNSGRYPDKGARR